MMLPIVFPIEHMRDTAAHILVSASNAQFDHDTAWKTIQHTLDDFDDAWRETIMDFLKPYADRIRASYDWQMNLAQAIFTMIDNITQTDTNVQQTFVTRHGPTGPIG